MKKTDLWTKAGPWLVILIAFIVCVQPVMGAGTLTYHGTIADGMPLYDIFVHTGTFAGSSDTFTIPATFIVDEEDYFYTVSLGLAWTAPIKLSTISGTTYTITGDDTETYKVVYKDYMDF